MLVCDVLMVNKYFNSTVKHESSYYQRPKVMSGGDICTIFAFNDPTSLIKPSKYEECAILGREKH